jgi:flagellar hook-length control protein FliK
MPRELTAAGPGPKPPVQERFSSDAVDAPATPQVSRDDKPVRSFVKAVAADAPGSAATEAPPADAVSAASALSSLSAGSGRDEGSGSSSHAQLAVDASAAAPIRAVRSAQAFARAMDVHMAAVAAPGAASHVQPAGVVNAAAATVPDDLSTQIVQAVRLQWSDGVGDARITLKPEYLGDVTVSLHVDQGNVTAVLHADSPAVRSWLQANEPLLGQALSEQGLKLERLTVSEQPPTEDGGAPNDDAPRQEEQPRRRRQRHDAAGFEIIL